MQTGRQVVNIEEKVRNRVLQVNILQAFRETEWLGCSEEQKEAIDVERKYLDVRV